MAAKVTTRLLMLLLAATALGCATGGGSTAANGGDARTAVVSGGAGEAKQTVAAPKDAAYTIYCADFTGPNHAAVADQVKAQTEKVSGLRDLYVVRGADRSVLYQGFYTTYDESVDKAEAARAKAARTKLETLVDARGQKSFPRTVFETLEAPDPTAPPEWDLHAAKGYWTLVICTYTDPVKGKQAAVDSVRDARKAGVEAYYLHKDGQSHVCIGSWPAEAVKRQEYNGDQDVGDVSSLVDPETLVISTVPLDPAWKDLRDSQGRPFKIRVMKVDVVDPSMRKAFGDYDYSVNGYVESQSRAPLLLKVREATDRADVIDAKPIDAGSTKGKKADPLLQRF